MGCNNVKLTPCNSLDNLSQADVVLSNKDMGHLDQNKMTTTKMAWHEPEKPSIKEIEENIAEHFGEYLFI